MGERLNPYKRAAIEVTLRAVPAFVSAWMNYLKSVIKEDDDKETAQETEQQQS